MKTAFLSTLFSLFLAGCPGSSDKHVNASRHGTLSECVPNPQPDEESLAGVQLEDGSWANWWDIVKSGMASKIVKFNDYNTVLNYTTGLKDIFNEEMREAAEQEREPFYLSAYTRLHAEQIKDFAKNREERINYKNEWEAHAFYMFVLMTGFYGTFAVTKSSIFSDLNIPFLPYSSGIEEFNGKALLNTYKSSFYALDKAFGNFTSGPQCFDGYIYFSDPSHSEIEFTNELKSTTVSEMKLIAQKPLKQRRMVAYRNIEKLVYLKFLKNKSVLLDEIYNRAIETHRDSLKKMDFSIFQSQASWKAFKEKEFRELNGVQGHFLKPWISELDRIVKVIEEEPVF